LANAFPKFSAIKGAEDDLQELRAKAKTSEANNDKK